MCDDIPIQVAAVDAMCWVASEANRLSTVPEVAVEENAAMKWLLPWQPGDLHNVKLPD